MNYKDIMYNLMRKITKELNNYQSDNVLLEWNKKRPFFMALV